MPKTPKTYLDIVRECDNFPYYPDDPIYYKSHLQNYFAFKVSGCPQALGYIPRDVVHQFTWPVSAWSIDHAAQEVVLSGNPKTPTGRSALVEATLKQMKAQNHPSFPMLRGWRNETFPIYGPRGELLLEMERCASALFGIVTSGVQLTCYVEDETNGLRVWIGRRSRAKQTYPGMLDSAAAGGLETGLPPSTAVVREAVEEASLAEEVIQRGLKCAGALSYYHMTADDYGGVGLLQPEVEYVYELRLDAGTVPTPGDSEVESFYLWGVEEVADALRRGEFKLNSAIVLIDFFIRHGVLTAEKEADYFEIIARLHRRLEFAASPGLPEAV